MLKKFQKYTSSNDDWATCLLRMSSSVCIILVDTCGSVSDALVFLLSLQISLGNAYGKVFALFLVFEEELLKLASRESKILL